MSDQLNTFVFSVPEIQDGKMRPISLKEGEQPEIQPEAPSGNPDVN
jgi:hypothetical protein